MPSAGIEPLYVYVYLSLVNQPPLSLWTSNPYSTARFSVQLSVFGLECMQPCLTILKLSLSGMNGLPLFGEHTYTFSNFIPGY